MPPSTIGLSEVGQHVSASWAPQGTPQRSVARVRVDETRPGAVTPIRPSRQSTASTAAYHHFRANPRSNKVGTRLPPHTQRSPIAFDASVQANEENMNTAITLRASAFARTGLLASMPGTVLRRLLACAGAEHVRWPDQSGRTLAALNPAQLRTLAGFSSMLPVAASAIAIGIITRSRRRGANFFTSTFSEVLLATSGVRLNVLGRENLSAQRPAVFIFNHRNKFDLVIAGALVRDNWITVGKKELENNPIMGIMGKLLDAVFIDRDDAATAVEALRTVEERAKNGLSVVIAPEGTRNETTKVGPFKKGPFRIAMSAGIPIVPIVIRNAETVANRNSNAINPGTVDVVVFPPQAVDNWTLDTLTERIAEVRELYVNTLDRWPVGPLPDLNQQSARQSATARPAKAASTNTATPTPTEAVAKEDAHSVGHIASKGHTSLGDQGANPSNRSDQ